MEQRNRTSAQQVSEESARRVSMWKSLSSMGDPENTSTTAIRDLRIYGGRRGIFRDLRTTGVLTADGTGVSVGVLHTGRHYPDDLSQDGMIYHYPETDIPGWDRAEIKATKKAGEFGLPIFAVISTDTGSEARDVRIGWIAGWDDDSRIFLISFEKSQPTLILPGAKDAEPFTLTERNDTERTLQTVRRGQQAFKLRVFQRYGPACCVCGLSVKGLLAAAHIRPRKKNGSNHPQNGLVLCHNHHKAFDDGLFVIDPHTFEIGYRRNGPDSIALGISKCGIGHLAMKPNEQALSWLWEQRTQIHQYLVRESCDNSSVRSGRQSNSLPNDDSEAN